MAKPGRKSAGGGTTSGTATRERLVDAAFQTLREHGYVGTSARAIATRAGCNSALIFYYFGSVDDLLVEALAWSSRTQLAEYEETLADVTELADLVAAVRQRLRGDMASGHVRVLVELLGASSSDAHLRTAVFALVMPWLALTERTLGRVLSAHGLGGLVPVEQISFLVVSLFLGMELLADATGNDETIDRLFASAHRLTGVLDALGPPAPPGPPAKTEPER
jgi:AcrR family transcriptional regulator